MIKPRYIFSLCIVVGIAYLLKWAYVDFVYPKYSYMGYRYIEPNYLTFFICSLVPAIIALVLPRRYDGIHSIILIIFYFQIVLPMWSVPLYTSENILFEQIAFNIVTSIIFISICFLLNTKTPRLPTPPLFNISLLKLISIITFLFVVLLYLKYGFNIKLLFSLVSFSDLYGIRDSYRESNSASGIYIYLFMWTTKVIVPFLSVCFLSERKYKYYVFTFLIQLCLFSISGHKSLILGFILATLVYFLIKKRRAPIYLFKLYLYGILITSLLVIFDINYSLFEVFVRRMVLMPGMLTGYYVEYFSTNGFDYYSSSFLKSVIDSQHHNTIPFLVGDNYFNRDNISANANMFASAYANYGVLGMMIEGVIFMLLLVIMKMVITGQKDHELSILFFLPLMSLTDSAFFTSVFTHGIGFSIIMAYFLSSYINSRKNVY